MGEKTRIELTRGMIGAADALLKWSFILNGASAAGLLTFVGNTVDKQAKFHNWSAFGSALLAFAVGLVLVLLAGAGKLLALNYAAQMEDPAPGSSPEELRIYLLVGDRAFTWGIVTLALFGISVVCFIVGVAIGKCAVFG